jgi:4-amino-4-deoxychorismate lyase
MTFMIVNGKLTLEKEATLPVHDHGLLYGVGAFETFRIYGGHPFLLYDHIDRLNRTLRKLGIPFPFTREEWQEQIQKLCIANSLQEGSIRITVTAGVAEWGLPKFPYSAPNTFLLIRPLAFEPKTLLSHGKRLQVVRVFRQAPGGVENYKTINFINNLIARQEVEDFPAVEGLLLTKEGYMAEGIVSNLFFVSKKELFTPCIELGIVDGITRAWVMKLAKSLGLLVHTGKYRVAELGKADEIFLTNSVQGIVPIYTWQGQRKRDLAVTSQLLDLYERYTSSLFDSEDFCKGSEET